MHRETGAYHKKFLGHNQKWLTRLKLKKATDSDSKIRNTVNGLDEQCKHCH